MAGGELPAAAHGGARRARGYSPPFSALRCSGGRGGHGGSNGARGREVCSPETTNSMAAGLREEEGILENSRNWLDWVSNREGAWFCDAPQRVAAPFYS